MSPKLLAAWAEALGAEVALAPDFTPRAEDAEETRLAELDAAFVRKLGAHQETWPEEAQRFYLQGITYAHHHFHPQAVA